MQSRYVVAAFVALAMPLFASAQSTPEYDPANINPPGSNGVSAEQIAEMRDLARANQASGRFENGTDYGNVSAQDVEGLRRLGAERQSALQANGSGPIETYGQSSAVSAQVSQQLANLQASLPVGPQGDEATACEVILCLAGSTMGGGISECVEPLRRYFSINLSRPWKTLRARANFLKLCPKGRNDATMESLVSSIVNAPSNDEGTCTASVLNAVNQRLVDGVPVIESTVPDECQAYYSHPYADLRDDVPVYVGEPEEGGFWAERSEYAAAVARYGEKRRQGGGLRPGNRPDITVDTN